MNNIKITNEKTVAELNALIELMGYFDKYKIKMPSWKLRNMWKFIEETVGNHVVCSQPFCYEEAVGTAEAEK